MCNRRFARGDSDGFCDACGNGRLERRVKLYSRPNATSNKE